MSNAVFQNTKKYRRVGFGTPRFVIEIDPNAPVKIAHDAHGPHGHGPHGPMGSHGDPWGSMGPMGPHGPHAVPWGPMGTEIQSRNLVSRNRLGCRFPRDGPGGHPTPNIQRHAIGRPACALPTSFFCLSCHKALPPW